MYLWRVHKCMLALVSITQSSGKNVQRFKWNILSFFLYKQWVNVSEWVSECIISMNDGKRDRITVARPRQDSSASLAKKIRLLEKNISFIHNIIYIRQQNLYKVLICNKIHGNMLLYISLRYKISSYITKKCIPTCKCKFCYIWKH